MCSYVRMQIIYINLTNADYFGLSQITDMVRNQGTYICKCKYGKTDPFFL